MLLIKDIAKVCYEVNRAYCKALGDDQFKQWDEAPQWQQDSNVLGVQMHVDNPDAGPERSHECWMEEKLKDGWVYGPVKDESMKQHPCLVPYEDLPTEQKAKDFIFRSIVHALQGK